MTQFSDFDANYAPNGAYDCGCRDRRSGKAMLPPSNDALFVEAYNRGWHDTDVFLLSEARKRNGISETSNGTCCKQFLQE